MARTLIILLAHNEAACIGRTVSEVQSFAPPETDILVVDDGSQDATRDVALAAGARVARHPINLGVAAGEATGLLFAKRKGYDRALRMDGDGQHDPRSIAPLLAELDAGTDMVVGSRFLGVASFRSSLLRRAGNQLLAGILTRLCKQRISDPTSGYRAFGPRALVLFSQTHPNEYPEPESLLMARRRGLKLVEIPAQMRPRLTGQSSLTPWKSAFYMVKVFFALTLELLRPAEVPGSER